MLHQILAELYVAHMHVALKRKVKLKSGHTSPNVGECFKVEGLDDALKLLL